MRGPPFRTRLEARYKDTPTHASKAAHLLTTSDLYYMPVALWAPQSLGLVDDLKGSLARYEPVSPSLRINGPSALHLPFLPFGDCAQHIASGPASLHHSVLLRLICKPGASVSAARSHTHSLSLAFNPSIAYFRLLVPVVAIKSAESRWTGSGSHHFLQHHTYLAFARHITTHSLSSRAQSFLPTTGKNAPP